MNLIAQEETIKKSIMASYYNGDKEILSKLQSVLANVQHKKGIQEAVFNPEDESQKIFSKWMKGLV